MKASRILQVGTLLSRSMMDTSQATLKFAHFQLKLGSLPNDATIPPHINELINKPIKVHDFTKELEVSNIALC